MIAGTPTPAGSNEARASALMAEAGELRPVADLGSRGIRQVRLLSQSQFETAVRDAVAREVLAYLGDLDLPRERRQILEERALARLSGDPVERPLPAEVAAPATLASADPSFDFVAMERRLVDEIGRLVAQNWRAELETTRDTHSTQITGLERRIDSLMRALDQVERLMDRVPAGGIAAPIGSNIPPSTGPLSGIKNELLEQLFQANLALRELEAGEELSNGDGPEPERR